MGKISLIKKPEELEAERIAKQRELEREIQAENQAQQDKVIALHNKQKAMTAGLIGIAAIFFIAMLVFGTYNTFFKHVLNTTDIQRQINGSINTYPTEGLNNYIRDNCQAMFNQYMSAGNKYEYVIIDENSVYISRVRTVSNTLADVWFSADVIVKETDTKVTDKAIIDRLRKNGFGVTEITPTPTPTPVPQTETVETTETIEPIENTEPVETVIEETQIIEETQPIETTVETQPTATPTPEPSMIENEDNLDSSELGSMEMTTNGETVEYFIAGNGTIYQRGKTVTQRYNFYVSVEFFSEKDADGVTVVAQGYRPATKLDLYLLNDISQTDFSTITIHPNYSFTEYVPVEENVRTAAKIKVNAILDDLYSGRDTSQSFYSYKTFNTFGASYVSMTRFDMYTTKNVAGYNVYCEYTIKTAQGFNYQVNCYMLVEPVGSGQDQTWKITRII